jgi:hypothetical protein
VKQPAGNRAQRAASVGIVSTPAASNGCDCTKFVGSDIVQTN